MGLKATIYLILDSLDLFLLLDDHVILDLSWNFFLHTGNPS